MNGFNKVIMMGTVGKDAEVRVLEGGSTVASFQIALNDSYVDKKTGERKQTTEWVRVEAWNKLAEFLGNYAKKGTALLVEGRLKNESYEKDGRTVYSTKVIANNVNFAGTKSTTQSQAAPAQAAPAQAAPAQAAQPQVAQPQVAQPQVAQPQVAQPQVAPAQVAPAQVAPAQAAPVVTSEQFVSGVENSQPDDLPF